MPGPLKVGSLTTVMVQSAWRSKINWAQAVAILSSLLVFGFSPSAALTPEQQVAIITVISLLQGAVTWILKTFFTTTVTPSSMPSK